MFGFEHTKYDQQLLEAKAEYLESCKMFWRNPTTRILQDQSFFFFSVTPRVPPPISLDISQTWSNGFLQSF